MPDGRRRPIRRPGTFLILGVLACLVIVGLFWWNTIESVSTSEPIPSLSATTEILKLDADSQSAIVAFCSDCHALPRPDSFERNQWQDEVLWGYKAYARSGRSDLIPPPMEEVLAYYQARAPEEMQFPAPEPLDDRAISAFIREPLDWGDQGAELPAVAHLRWQSLSEGQSPRLLVCDMRDGTVSAVQLEGSQRRRLALARFDHPCHAEPCDLDADGRTDLLVAELGSFFPSDHDRGRVIWMRRAKDDDTFLSETIVDGLGRVTDARACDLDGDGDQDVIAAEFGNFTTGSIALLRNIAAEGQPPHFSHEQLDPRSGTIHIPIHDFNADGRPDFVALVSQEYEMVDLFLNQGDGKFRMQNVWAGPDLAYGSSGIELVDFDGDGDTDILYSNGDSFDNQCVNLSHGIQWLENLGDTRFEHHRIADFLGVYRALPGDFDRDGDLDVISVAFLPGSVKPASALTPQTASVLLLERMPDGEFTPRTLECGFANHATCEVGDFDDDGDLDFVTGTFVFSHDAIPGTPHPCRLTVWWNQAVPAKR